MNRKDILPRLFRFIKIRETGKRYLFPDVFSNIHLQEDCSFSASSNATQLWAVGIILPPFLFLLLVFLLC
ncbi:MAG: hypothetical protein J6S98_00065, partial [Lentisphaeria bacterium]|nr:hypothetical protein [Lentisphaeria bacterium]